MQVMNPQQQWYIQQQVQQPQQQQNNSLGQIPAPSLLLTKNKGAAKPSALLLGCHIDARKQNLDKMNVSHVLNCAKEIAHFRDGEGSFTGRSVKYHIIPWADMYQFNKFVLNSYFEQFIRDIVEAHDFMMKAFNDLTSGNVLIHCAAGVNRSVTLSISFIMRTQHKNLYDSMLLVQKQRNIAKPSSYHLLQLLKYQSWLYYQGDASFAGAVFTVPLHSKQDHDLLTHVVANFVAGMKLAFPQQDYHMERLKLVALKYWTPTVQHDMARGVKRVLIPTVQQVEGMLNELLVN